MAIECKTEVKASDSKQEQKSDAKPKEEEKDQQPTTSSSNDTLSSGHPIDIGRSYSPIIEDPRERDSRPASTDPIEDRRDTISPNLMDNNASIPSRSVSPVMEPTRITSSETKVQTDTKEASTTVAGSPPKTNLAVDAQPSSSSSRQTTPEPIFRPLITEKGKSKTTGKNIGGWI